MVAFNMTTGSSSSSSSSGGSSAVSNASGAFTQEDLEQLKVARAISPSEDVSSYFFPFLLVANCPVAVAEKSLGMHV
jgi:hypothetical protein